jgi:redox-sensing transcriptional repressor
VETITSARLGEALEVDPSQVRKDFAAIGLMGMSRIGYDACEVCSTIRRVVGFDLSYPAALVGAGMLGSAILGYTEFERYGFRVVAAFDRDPFKVGRRIGGRTIMPSTELGGFVEKHHIPLAILTTPAEAAQELTDTLVAAGVAAIWNFTSVRLTVPPGVLVRNERFTAGLAEIAYHLSRPELSEAAHAPTSRMT